MKLEHIIQSVEQELSKERFEHTKGVADTAEILAKRFGADPEKAQWAGWIHDIAREWPVERMKQFAHRIEVPAGFETVPALLHGPIAAHRLRAEFANSDEDTANAVRFHTTGRVGMSRLEKVVFLADAIEPGRKFPDVEKLRGFAQTDLNRAVAESLDSVIRFLLEKHQFIFPLTVMTRNDLWQQVKNEYDEK